MAHDLILCNLNQRESKTVRRDIHVINVNWTQKKHIKVDTKE